MLFYLLLCFVVGAGDLPAAQPVSFTNATLVHLLVGSDHVIAAGLHTLTPHTHRRGVGAAGCPVNHLHRPTHFITHAIFS